MDRWKRVIGTAWLQKKIIHMDWSRIAARWGGTAINQDQFTKLPINTRSGFTHAEFIGIVGKYSEILGVPIWNEQQTKCIGIYAIDVPMGLGHGTSGTASTRPLFMKSLSSCAAVLSNVFVRSNLNYPATKGRTMSMSASSTDPSPEQARAAYFNTLKTMHPSKNLSAAIKRAESSESRASQPKTGTSDPGKAR
ncbi:MAG: hypothetical protein WDM88_04475 [Galbitalea sp.]